MKHKGNRKETPNVLINNASRPVALVALPLTKDAVEGYIGGRDPIENRGNTPAKSFTTTTATPIGNAPRRVVAVNDRGHVIGEDHHRAALTDHECDLIRELRADGMQYPEIARKFEIRKSTVWYICNGQRRGQIATGQKRRP